MLLKISILAEFLLYLQVNIKEKIYLKSLQMIGNFFSTFLPVFKNSLKRFVYGSLFVVLFLYFFVRCVDFSIYSDANEVKAVKADIVTTDDVIIDKEEIVSGEEGRILLNVKGKIEDCLPLTIRTDFELSAQYLLSPP